jgi:hypothetical protein
MWQHKSEDRVSLPPLHVPCSRKGRALEGTGKAAFTVYWEKLQRQVGERGSKRGIRYMRLMRPAQHPNQAVADG